MKKVLFTANVVRKHINEFHLPYIKWFKDNGYETYVAAKNDFENEADCIIPNCDYYIDIDFCRNPFSRKNVKSYKDLKKLINDNDFDIIHCHTPICGVLTRLAAKKARKKKTKVVYTAHGFYFYNGSSLINWLLYYPVEKYCSKFTDVLITMNQEDYDIANKKFKAKETYLVHGVGVNFDTRDKTVNDDIYIDMGCTKEDYVLCTVGELTQEKNQMLIIKALESSSLAMKANVKYVLVGDGKMMESDKEYVRSHNLENRIIFMGYRTDVLNILMHSDLFIFPSLREGLPISPMEAMYCELPCVVNDTRGIRDLAKGPDCCVCKSIDDYITSIEMFEKRGKKRSNFNKELITPYLIENVLREYALIYESLSN